MTPRSRKAKPGSTKKAARKPARPRAAAATTPRRKAAATPRRKAAPAPLAVQPRLRVVRGGAKPASFPQRARATHRQLVMFELVRARAAFLSAVQGLAPASAGEPIGPGQWSPREIVLHLVTRDLHRLEEFDAVLEGAQPSWRDVPDDRMAVINTRRLAPLVALDWETALRQLSHARKELIERLEGVPDFPAEVWAPEHPFGWMIHALPPHDRHHADQIKRWRATRGAGSAPPSGELS